MDKFSFVYSLLDEGNMFYIGCTSDLVKRFNMHLNSAKSQTTATAKRIKTILSDSRLPDMMIINRLPTKEAFKLEMILIKSLSSGGHTLTNGTLMRDFNFRRSCKTPDNPTRKQMVAIIKERQISCARFNTFDNPYYSKWQITTLEYR